MAFRAQDIARRLGASRTRSADELAVTLRRFGEPLPDLRQADAFADRFDRFGAAQVVLLGEATHGTSEFYRARAAITRRLIERHGFSIVAVEADWPDAARIDAYVRHFEPKPSREESFARFPQWMWRNAEFAEFVDWLRTHNRSVDEQQRVTFRGLDIYSLRASIASVSTISITRIRRRPPQRADIAAERRTQ